MKIYDGCIFYNEFDLLELRMNELWDIIDKFIIVESNETFANNFKPLYLRERLAQDDNFRKKYIDKIIHIIIKDMPKMANGNRWPQEEHSFNAIDIGFIQAKAKEDDIILVSAVDEIPKKETLLKCINKIDDGPYCMVQKFYYYYLNCLNVSQIFHGTAISKYKYLTTPNDFIINRRFFNLIENGGWHFSYLGGIETIIEKLESFSHSEYDNPYFKDLKRLQTKIENNEDIFERNIQYAIVPINESYPKYILNNLNKYSQYIKK